MKISDWAKIVMWAVGVSIGLVLLLCAPLIWQSLRNTWSLQSTNAESQKWFGYLLLMVIGKCLLIDPIASKLRDIAGELKEFNRRESLKS